MRITDMAAEAILKVMRAKKLDPKKFCLQIGNVNGFLSLYFDKQENKPALRFGDLAVVIQPDVDSTGVVLDFGNVKGRSGLIFMGEKDVYQSNGTSNS